MKKILYTLLIVPLLGFAQNESPCYSINDIFFQMDGENPSLEVNLVAGWNMIGYPCTQDMLLTDGFSSIDDKISMVKNNNGAVYIPEFNFNGIGFLESGQGYQVKTNEFVMGFSFCGSIQYPNLEGCTDCEAVNFNQWANVDDGSCNYDSDGDGVSDSEEIVGCQDSLACDYNINATDSGECSYSQEGYDCEGNITAEIGDIIEGGYLFYLDETGTRGLVAAMEDVSEEALRWFYAMDSLDNFISNSQYDDWYVPRKNELELMYSSFGDESTYVDFNFSPFYSYWSATENENLDHWVLRFYNGSSDWINSANTCLVRPIRAFGNWTMGCMDSLACNYNPEADMADGSCEYPEQGYDCEGNIIIQVGDLAEGGIVFYVDVTGERGLVAAMGDLEGTYEWGCSLQDLLSEENSSSGFNLGTGHLIYGSQIGEGYINSSIIAQNCLESTSATTQVMSYENEGFNDWFLPSIFELLEIYNQLGPDSNLGNIANLNTSGLPYWSSTEDFNPANAWLLFPLEGGQYDQTSKTAEVLVRPIRAFGYTLGCMDSLACNYNPDANMADGSCEYAELGYDCEGNITAEIGDIIEGGYLFYIDETGQHGLVAATEDLTEGATAPYGWGYNGYEWGCYGQGVNGADGTSIGTGYQNTIDIVNQGCSTDNGGITAAQAALDAEINGYSDWYLPSKGELLEMYNTIGNGSAEGDIGGFGNSFYWSSSEDNYNYAWFVYFDDGSTLDYDKNATLRVRVIRSF